MTKTIRPSEGVLPLDRRALLGAGVGAMAVAAGQAAPARAQVPVAVPAANVTGPLSRYLVAARYEDLPADVRREGVRTLLNYVGVGVGGSRHETVDKAITALAPFAGKAQANVLGRRERFDIVTTALINGISSHIFDYDDTHLKTIIHPAGPVISAALALAQYRPVSGAQFLNAVVLGIETECRIGNAVYPNHYDIGWHITGSAGMFGSAAACGKLLGLDAQQMAWALGIAASQPVGVKIQFGSMTKSFHPGRAAQNGLTAALLAAQGYTANDAAIEGKDGWGQATSTKRDWKEVTDGLGSRYEAALNTYKPFACGIVTHPGIDAAIQLRNENKLTADQIEAVELAANPLVLSLTGKTEFKSGLDGKFSIYHCVAAGLIYGAAGERQFSDAVVADPTVAALRRRITVRTDPAIATQKTDMTVRLKDGRVLTKHIENAIGSLARPMSDADLEAKFTDLAQGILPDAKTRRLIDMCRGVEALTDAGAVARAATA